MRIVVEKGIVRFKSLGLSTSTQDGADRANHEFHVRFPTLMGRHYKRVLEQVAQDGELSLNSASSKSSTSRSSKRRKLVKKVTATTKSRLRMQAIILYLKVRAQRPPGKVKASKSKGHFCEHVSNNL